MKISVVPTLLVTFLGLVSSATVTAQEAGNGPEKSGAKEGVPEFGGPSSTPSQLTEDERKKEPAFRFDGLQRGLAPYFDFKRRMAEDYGFTFGGDYTTVFQTATNSPGEDSAIGGNFRLFGNWTLTGRDTVDTGSVVFKVESRHTLGTDVPPSDLGFESGTVGLYAAPFNDAGWWLTNLYWHQKASDGKIAFVAGWVDATDYIDVYGLINPWTAFMNLAFITGSGTMPLPNQGLGAGFRTMVGDNAYFTAGLTDSNSDPGAPGTGFDSFFNDREYFAHAELGWTPSFDRRYLDNAHVTIWHADERDDAGVPDGWGVNFSVARFIDDTWMPFARGGFADDGGSLLQRSISVGLGRYMSYRKDLLGVGLNWGDPSRDFGSGLDDQYTSEMFYRVQISENFAITPDLQIVQNPALNPDDDTVVVLGLRARLSF